MVEEQINQGQKELKGLQRLYVDFAYQQELLHNGRVCLLEGEVPFYDVEAWVNYNWLPYVGPFSSDEHSVLFLLIGKSQA